MVPEGLKDYAGAVFVVAVVVIGTAVAVGSGLLSAAVLIGIAFFALLLMRGRRGAKGSSDVPGQPTGTSFSFYRVLSVRTAPDRSALEAALVDHGLKVDRGASSGSIVAVSGGSQLRTRLLGGYFVTPSSLPIRAEVTLPTHDGPALEVKVRVQDRLGIGIRDRALKRRYEAAAEEVEKLIEDSVGAAAKGTDGVC